MLLSLALHIFTDQAIVHKPSNSVVERKKLIGHGKVARMVCKKFVVLITVARQPTRGVEIVHSLVSDFKSYLT